MRRRDRELAARRLATLTAAQRSVSASVTAGWRPERAAAAAATSAAPVGAPRDRPEARSAEPVTAGAPSPPGTPDPSEVDPTGRSAPSHGPAEGRVATSHAVELAARAYASEHAGVAPGAARDRARRRAGVGRARRAADEGAEPAGWRSIDVGPWPAPDAVPHAGRRRVEPRRRTVVRWSVAPRAAAAASIAILLCAGAVALHAARGAPGEPVTLPTPDAAGSAASSPVVVGEVVVDVVGEVTGPGVVRLPTGSRVVDAVAAAGGATADADLAALNLARVLVDGEQIVVPRPGQSTSPTTAAPGSHGGGDDALVDLNSADLATLDTLPGVGPVLAQRIVDARAKRPFSSVDELADVPGIGPTLLARLRPLVRP